MRFHLLPIVYAALSWTVSASSATAGTRTGGMGTVIFESMEGAERTVPVLCAKQSKLAETMMTEDKEDDESQEIPQKIPLPMVKTDTLDRIIEYLGHHAEHPAAPIPKPLPSSNLAEAGVSEWDRRFISFGVEDTNDIEALSRIFPRLKDIIDAANYMDIQGLLELSTSKVATLIYGKSQKDVQTIMGVSDDDLAAHRAQLARDQQAAREKARDNYREAMRMAREALTSTTTVSPTEPATTTVEPAEPPTSTVAPTEPSTGTSI
jgi:S-phase kinase-associated protein 1